MAFSILLQKYLNGELQPDELQDFLECLNRAEHREMLVRALDERLHASPSVPLITNDATRQLFEKAMQKAEVDVHSAGETRRRFPSRLQLARAAIFICVTASVTLYFWPKAVVNQKPAPVANLRPVTHDVQPGSNKAMLTLGDGSTLELGVGAKGTLSHQGSADVLQVHSGQLLYQPAGGAAPLVYNTMTTPAGGQYEVVLPDRTHVWLNASSSLTYPTSFASYKRLVVLKGEAYFEVAPNHNSPFVVQVGNMDVTVLGTHFNVNAYDDESIKKTTLLEGAIRVKTRSATATLSGGQQVTTTSEGVLAMVKNPDIDESVAWKNGLFSFNNAELASIMRQFSRWYDITVRYEGTPPARRFSGDIFRNLNLSEALKVLELNDVHFRIDGNNLTVTQ